MPVPAGWYADVNAPGTDRYWNGTDWTQETRPAVAPPTPPAALVATPASPPVLRTSGYAVGTPGTGAYEGLAWDGKKWVGQTIQPGHRNGKGTASLVLGIISVILCGGGLILPILATVFGRQGMQAADTGLADNRGVAKAGFILGIVALSMSAVLSVIYLVAFISDPSAFR